MSAVLTTAGAIRVAILEVGEAGSLAPELAFEAGKWFRSVAEAEPHAVIELAIGGFDEDPRELWNIPGVRAYLVILLRSANIQDWRSPLVLRFGEPTLLLLLKCEALGDDHPFTTLVHDTDYQPESMDEVQARAEGRRQTVRDAMRGQA